MSEHQVYEFVALDRPLTEKQMAELRAISTRAKITPSRFWNEYHRGGLAADPAQLLLRYFDTHLYSANWGSRRLMLRLPREGLDVKALKACFPAGGPSTFKVVRASVVLDFQLGEESYPDEEEASPGSLAALIPLRTELQRGDLRAAYLAWLGAVQAGGMSSAAKEPLVPEGLDALSAAQQALVGWLRIDEDLLTAAARGVKTREDDSRAFRAWVRQLAPKEQTRWLLRAVDDPERPLGAELLRTFRAEHAPADPQPMRTVRELQTLRDVQRAARERAEAARVRAANAVAARNLQRRLTALSRDVDGAWSRLEHRVAASEYDEALRLAEDLRALAARDGELAGFMARFALLRGRQSRRRGFFDCWKRQDSV